MSVKLMTAVWQLQINLTDKIVLLALADNSSDEGFCWPSVPTLMKKCCLSRRGVQSAVARLQKEGHLDRVFRDGRSTNYIIKAIMSTCAPNAPPRARGAPPPAHVVRPEPSIEPSKNLAGRKYDKKKEVLPATWEDEELPFDWHTYAENRGIPEEQIFKSWRKFKDTSKWPMKSVCWLGWINKERSSGR